MASAQQLLPFPKCCSANVGDVKERCGAIGRLLTLIILQNFMIFKATRILVDRMGNKSDAGALEKVHTVVG
jgi:hypothetical protein